ncbi:hypothetical protein NOCARDAX2BIS_420009 [Nocardioides sp. AX2bis]|nr:hypothetical protein NOCARDAX2BIS_420009 [Nocardioides sp. AX2bis]
MGDRSGRGAGVHRAGARARPRGRHGRAGRDRVGRAAGRRLHRHPRCPVGRPGPCQRRGRRAARPVRVAAGRRPADLRRAGPGRGPRALVTGVGFR